MRNVLIIISFIGLLVFFSCKKQTAEQPLFENIESCKIYLSLLDSASLAYELLIKSDSIIIKNIRGNLSKFKIEVDASLLAKIDPTRFPYWGKGYPLNPCNVPEPLRNDSY